MKKTKFFVYIFIISVIVIYIYCNLYPTINPADTAIRRSSCAHNMKVIGLALLMYGNSHQGNYPNINGDQGLEILITGKSIGNKQIFQCMKDATDSFKTKMYGHKFEEMGDEFKPDYLYLGGFRENTQPEVPMLFDKIGNHEDYCNVLFSNRRIETFNLKYATYDELIEFINKQKHYPEKTIKTIKQKIQKALKNNNQEQDNEK